MTAAPMGRRRVLTAAAWSVPAVVVASAAPAFAASSAAAMLPSGLDYDWNAAVQVQRSGQTYFVNRTGANTVSYELYDAASDVIPASTYYTNVVFTFSWNVSESVTPTLVAANGWSLAPGSVLAAGTVGTVAFVPDVPLHNGAANALTLPQIRIASTVTGVNPAAGGTISTALSGTNLGGVNGGITI